MTIDKETLKYVWHYTKAEYLPLIKESGALIPKSEAESNKIGARKGGAVSIVPMIWFSSNQNWEFSAVQLAGVRWHTWQQIAAQDCAIRFGLQACDSRLLNWEESCNAAGVNREERRLRKAHVKKQRKIGSDATKWFTSLDPIPLEDLCFQMWLDGKWTELDSDLVINRIKELGLSRRDTSFRLPKI
ncbi:MULTISPECIES: hypothetical protein [unclassified Methylophilus]|uniref:hypothetical protein n=1 Tax=unclassified Methylophilus TaxID=2630143 RepID=UPI0006FC316A|nr:MULTISPECIES: hypothetical protein [unclassified Methylophilus]KQT42230.1 hypothetical protein ASG34_05580 [Methylophilus sp. Leaf416]KQT56412.1 hypothetical protein ASG44_05555 [Methylophilus sp. Leaf459]